MADLTPGVEHAQQLGALLADDFARFTRMADDFRAALKDLAEAGTVQAAKVDGLRDALRQVARLMRRPARGLRKHVRRAKAAERR